jgi:hypothetical protein
MDQDTLRFINTFGPWLSAIGTLIAVAVSLHLARRSDQLKLEVRVGLRNVGVMPALVKPYTFFLRPNVISDAPPDLLVVSVTNLGRRTARLAQMWWHAGGRARVLGISLPKFRWASRLSFLWTPIINEYSFEFPKILADGDSAFYSWPLEGGGGLKRNFTKSFDNEFAGWWGAIRLRRLRFYVATSTGEVFRQKPEKELLQLFKELAKKPIR